MNSVKLLWNIYNNPSLYLNNKRDSNGAFDNDQMKIIIYKYKILMGEKIL